MREPRFRPRFEGLEGRIAPAVYTVAPGGSNAAVGSADAPWQTLQYAADRVAAGDTVVVRPGDYAGFDLWTGGTAGAPITSFGYSVSPSTVAPGGTVTLRVTDCDRKATASSGVFDAVTLQGSGGTKSGTATVDSDAKPGAEYDVTFTCGSESGTAPLTITTTAPTVPVTPLTPAGGVQTGLGRSVSGPDAAEIAAGAVLSQGPWRSVDGYVGHSWGVQFLALTSVAAVAASAVTVREQPGAAKNAAGNHPGFTLAKEPAS